MENLDLCKVLKDYETKTFYSPLFGDTHIVVKDTYISAYDANDPTAEGIKLKPNGKITEKGELMLFPSKDQGDWDKWIKEQSIINYKNICKQIFAKSHVEVVMPIKAVNIAQLNKLLAINELTNVQKWIEKGWQPNWEDKNEAKYYIYIEDKIHIDWRKYHNGCICYFSSEENAQKAIDILGEDVIRAALSVDW